MIFSGTSSSARWPSPSRCSTASTAPSTPSSPPSPRTPPTPRRAGALPARAIDEVRETLEQVERVVRAGGGFGMVLDGERVELGDCEAFAGLVVQVKVRRLRTPFER